MPRHSPLLSRLSSSPLARTRPHVWNSDQNLLAFGLFSLKGFPSFFSLFSVQFACQPASVHGLDFPDLLLGAPFFGGAKR